VKIVVLGSGLAGVTSAEGLAKAPGHEVTLVTAENRGYYSRPRLSHGLALAEPEAAKIVLKRFDALPAAIRVLSGVHAGRIDRAARQLELADGNRLDYDVLILATGSAARIPPPLLPHRERFFILNSLDDLAALRALRAGAARPLRWAVIGGGLIGCEVASDLHKAGDAVTIFHREARLMELTLAEGQSQALHEHFAALGIEVKYNQVLDDLPAGFDAVIVSTGFAPRVELAKEAGLATARGIVVNQYLRTADAAIYAVGDVAEVEGRLYPFVSPIRSQALWLAAHLAGSGTAPWTPPAFTPVIKVHGFKLPAAAPLA
jgi:NAD(P)H-nitrite reductase large subunit